MFTIDTVCYVSFKVNLKVNTENVISAAAHVKYDSSLHLLNTYLNCLC